MPSLVCRTPRQMSRTATCKYGGYTLHEPSDQIRARQLTASLDDGVVAYAPLVRHLFARRENILKVCQHRRHSRASARSTTRARTPCASVKSWVDRLDADIRAVHAHAQGVPRYRRPPFRLATVTFDPELHDLSSAADTRTARRARASVYIDEVVDWYRARLRDYEYCAFSDPTLRGVARRYVRVERMAKRGRVAVVFPGAGGRGRGRRPRRARVHRQPGRRWQPPDDAIRPTRQRRAHAGAGRHTPSCLVRAEKRDRQESQQ